MLAFHYALALCCFFPGISIAMKYENKNSGETTDIAAKINDAENVLSDFDLELKNIGLNDLSYSVEKTGGIAVNVVGTYMKIEEIGKVYRKWVNNDPKGSLKDLMEAIVTLCLFDIPGMVTPALEVYQDIMEELKDPNVYPDLNEKLGLVNSNLKKTVTGAKDPNNPKFKKISDKLHKGRKAVGDEITKVIDNNPNFKSKIHKAGKLMKSASKTMAKVGGTMNALSILYAGGKFVEAMVDENYNDAVEQGLVLIGSFVSLAATYAAAASPLGPIGIVAGALIGGVACVYGMLKPDKESELEEHMKDYNMLALNSIKYLQQDFEILPKIMQDIQQKQVTRDWFFEANQNSLRKDMPGIEPDGPLKFTWKGDNEILRVNGSECKEWSYTEGSNTVKSGACVSNGVRRHINKEYLNEGSWFNTYDGIENFDHPSDFYGFIPDESRDYTGTTIFVRTDLLRKNGRNDKIRGISINTVPPSQFQSKGDDTLVLYDLKNLKMGEKVDVNLGGGDDAIIVYGTFGEFDEGTKDESVADISFSGHQRKGSKEDYGGMISFSAMDINEKNQPKRMGDFIDGIEFMPATVRNRGKICYLWKEGKQCSVTISRVAMFGSSPFNDVIHMDSNTNMIVVNDAGTNRYIFKVTRDAPIKTNQIIDKEGDHSVFEVQAEGIDEDNVKFVYSTKDEAIEIYYRGNIWWHLTYKTIIKGSKSKPVIEYSGKTISFNELLLGPALLTWNPNGFNVLIDGFRFTDNAQIHRDSRAVCVCNVPMSPGSRRENYLTIKGDDKIDHLVITNSFISHVKSNNLAIHVVNDISMNDDNQPEEMWSMHVRCKDDIYSRQYPRFDVRLDNIEVIVNEKGTVLFDLTNPLSLVNDMDLVHRYSSIQVLRLGGKLKGLMSNDGNDYVFIAPDRHPDSQGRRQSMAHLGDGTNTLVYDMVKHKDKKVTYQATALDGADDLGGFSLIVSFEPTPSKYESTRVLNVDRLVCQFEGGIQRDLDMTELIIDGGAKYFGDECAQLELGEFKDLDYPKVYPAQSFCQDNCKAING